MPVQPYVEETPKDLALLRAIGRGFQTFVEGYLRQLEAERQKRWVERLRQEDWRNRLLERMMPSFGDLYSIAQMEERRRRWSALRGILNSIFAPYYASL